MLGPEQQHQVQQQQQRQHQNYMNNSYEPVQQSSLSMAHEAQARAGPADYQTSHLMHTVAGQHGKPARPKN